ncbi:MAG: inorganic phosphate transporter [Clostridia bacterium]|nr:inorganic phosphate transporter [Clostridiaceae bacterium]HQM95946.1 inorganic phosphate transporter [Clostridia bacterium]HQO69128.1 inorganic phosphate transporter [Clostridia bacterium]
MQIELSTYLSNLSSNPLLVITTLFTMAVILVNGWTDAPNAIATCVSTRSISPKMAVLMAAVFNFLGVLVMTLVNSTVAQTLFNMVDFGDDYRTALAALCAGLCAIVIWAVAAWIFGIPTSESHALVAGISGAGIAVSDSFSSINGPEIMKVVYGLLFSTILGFIMGYLTVKLVELMFRKTNKTKTARFFQSAQVGSAALMAFMHGAQDGQKFMGIYILGIYLSQGIKSTESLIFPMWMMILCSAVMGLGTSIGGYRIMKTVGMSMVNLEKYQGFSADLAAAGCLLISSLTGIPVSTTHTKTTAIMGVGAAKRLRNVNWGVAKEMVLTWIFTFPGCGLIGYLMTKLFLKIF